MLNSVVNGKGGPLQDTFSAGSTATLPIDSHRFFLFRNFFVNLTKSLIHLSAQEPLKASICGNLTNFIKLSLNEVSIDEIIKIANRNLNTCCYFIEKVGVTQVNEIASQVYEKINEQVVNSILTNSSLTNISTSTSISSEPFLNKLAFNLKIVSQSNFTEKTHVRSIDNSEYQEIRSFLIQIGRKHH